VAETRGDRFVVHTRSGDQEFVPGVNLGATTPGHAPGELAITAADYRRWFKDMGQTGIRAVRIYTIHPPAFYEELAAYNRAHPVRPLYLVQGVYLPDEAYLTDDDLFADATTVPFRAELHDAVKAVHGQLRRSPRHGRASGHWTTDVGQWVMGWVIGVEWDPNATKASDDRNRSRPGYGGTYFSSTPEASPTERWLAEKLDIVARLEAAHGRTMPLAFVNWPTTDPLRHPDEPLRDEDLVGIDANHVASHPAWPGGEFASYHAYPYYPDFQRYQPDITSFRRNGQADNYAGYLHLLQQHHPGMPVLVTETGVPSALGSAHNGPLGRSQGDHSEQDAMSTDADLLQVVHDVGLGGAFLFEWTDEWFKFTWNTVDLQRPADRRPLWHDALTNEQHFGLHASDGGERARVVVGAGPDQWRNNGSKVIFRGPTTVEEVRATHDEEYLYLRVRLRSGADLLQPITIGLDVVTGGNGGLPDHPGVDPAADYAVTLRNGPEGRATAWVRASNDSYVIPYGAVRHYFPVDPSAVRPGSGVWDPFQLILNRPVVDPRTGERRPIEVFPAGDLRRGTTDPSSPGFDNRATWDAAGSSFEVRLPWVMIGFSDPSSRQALVVQPDGSMTSTPSRKVGITVVAGAQVAPTAGYSWPPWQIATSHERPKVGLSTLKEKYRSLAP
jgi:hypothetical protein